MVPDQYQMMRQQMPMNGDMRTRAMQNQNFRPYVLIWQCLCVKLTASSILTSHTGHHTN